MYYVYAHTKPSGEIFYIGKGKGKRAYDSSNRNRHWQFVVNKHGFLPVILAEFEDECTALKEEALLVSHFKVFNCLVNMTAGGEVNPMSNPAVAKQVAATKRAKGQYANAWAVWNTTFRQNMQDPAFAKVIKEKRQKAQQKSLEVRKKTMLVKSKEVTLLRQQGLKYDDISKKLNVSIGFISKVVNHKGTYA